MHMFLCVLGGMHGRYYDGPLSNCILTLPLEERQGMHHTMGPFVSHLSAMSWEICVCVCAHTCVCVHLFTLVLRQ